MVEDPGEIILEPVAATAPIPWSIFTEVALDTDQFKLDDAPDEMVSGLALNALITGEPVPAGVEGVLGPETITCVVAVELPAGPEAVRTYVVLDAGAIALVPLSATFPIPLSIVTVVAPVTLQLRVELPPG